MTIKKKIDEYQKTQGLNLYFKNIDESSYDEETLKKKQFQSLEK